MITPPATENGQFVGSSDGIKISSDHCCEEQLLLCHGSGSRLYQATVALKKITRGQPFGSRWTEPALLCNLFTLSTRDLWDEKEDDAIEVADNNYRHG